MALIDQHDVAENVTFQKRVKVAIVNTALTVAAEPTNTPAHTARLTLALNVLNDPARFAVLMAFGVAAAPNVDVNSADSVILNRVAGMWTAYAIRR